MSANVPDHIAALATLRAACCVAAQDGRIAPTERPILDRLAERAGVGAVSLNAMIAEAEDDPDFSREQFEIVRTDPEPTLQALAAIAASDGAISDAQQAVLTTFAGRLGVDAERLGRIVTAATAAVEETRIRER